MLFTIITGFLLDKKIGVNQPKRIENAKILIANTSMDADKIKVSYGTMYARRPFIERFFFGWTNLLCEHYSF